MFRAFFIPKTNTMRRLILTLAGLLLLCACRTMPSSVNTPNTLRIDEASGLTHSLTQSGIFWTHNDSRDFFDPTPTEPLLFAVDAQGKLQGELWLEGVKPYDWEAISHFKQNGKAYLLIADIGDNRAQRSNGIRLTAIEEPQKVHGRLVSKPAWSLSLRYPDGSRDAESLAVDETDNAIYILSKRDNEARLYRAELPEGRNSTQMLRLLGTIQPLDAPVDTAEPFDLKVLPFTHQPTDMAFSPDRSEVAVLSYAHIYVYPRSPQQSWLAALQGTPQVIPLPGARQYEGLSYTADGQAWVVVREDSNETAPQNIAAPVLTVERPVSMSTIRSHEDTMH